MQDHLYQHLTETTRSRLGLHIFTKHKQLGIALGSNGRCQAYEYALITTLKFKMDINRMSRLGTNLLKNQAHTSVK